MGKRRTVQYFIPVSILLMIFALPFLVKRMGLYEGEHAFRKDTLLCAISLGNFDQLSKGYLTGYNYELLRHFAESEGAKAEIDIVQQGLPLLDSLRSESLDILAVPKGAFRPLNGLTESTTLDSSMVWIVKTGQGRARDVDKWIQEFRRSENYIPTRDRFFNGYNPYRKRRDRTGIISPYDGLLQAYSKVMEWDWKLFAALIWQESKFCIQARSGRGALGLLQMMPHTAGRYDVENRIDPEQSIRAGAEYIALLKRMFRNYAADEQELTKFTLAAYNSGEGRILDCIRQADSLGRGHAVWDSVRTVPCMSAETDGFVDAVLQQYGKFKTY